MATMVVIVVVMMMGRGALIMAGAPSASGITLETSHIALATWPCCWLPTRVCARLSIHFLTLLSWSLSFIILRRCTPPLPILPAARSPAPSSPAWCSPKSVAILPSPSP